MSHAIAIGIADVKSKGLRLAIAAVVATIVLEMMMRVGAPNILGIAPMSPANLVTNSLGLPQGHVFGTVVHFDQDVHTQRLRLAMQTAEGFIIQRRDNQQNAIGAKRARFNHLVRIDDEVLANNR